MENKKKAIKIGTRRPLVILLAVVALIAGSWLPAGLAVPPHEDGGSAHDALNQLGTGGSESGAVEFKDGSAINEDCGVLSTVCVGAGAVVVDEEHEIILVSIFGYPVVTIKVGLSLAVAASGGLALAIPTGSVWARGWGEVVGGDYSEYTRNGFESGDNLDDNCFEFIPLSFASCKDAANVSGDGGNCVRALAQAKASNLVEAAVASNSPTEVYAAAETKDTCRDYDDFDLEVLLGKIQNAAPFWPEDEEHDDNPSNHRSAACFQVGYDDLPAEAQAEVLNLTVEQVEDNLDYGSIKDAASSGGVRENLRLEIAHELVSRVSARVITEEFTACPGEDDGSGDSDD